MMDIGVHMTDLSRYLLGEITEVFGVMSESIWQLPGSEDNAIAIFRNPAGVYASYHATWTEWKGYQFYIEAYGDRGMVRGAYAPMQNLLITQTAPGAPRITRRRRYPGIMLREKIMSWHSTARLSFAGELKDFVAMIAGAPSGPLADGFAGLRSVEVAAAVRESSATRSVIHLPELGTMR
jgi:predicted dehydrogenase